MTQSNNVRLDFFAKLLGLIAALITLVSAVIGLGKVWQGGTGLVTVALLAIGAAGAWLGCLYVYKRERIYAKGHHSPKWSRLRVPHYPEWARHLGYIGTIVIPLLVTGGIGYYAYQQSQPPSKIILLVANFDGPEPQKYRVTETVLTHLRQALARYDDVQVEALGRAITEAEGSASVRAEGAGRKAAIVIWGWYGVTAEMVPLSVHFELLRRPEHLPELGPTVQGEVQILAVAGLERFTLQTKLSAELAYLSLFTVGMSRYTAGDWDAAITSFSDALNQTVERVSALDQSMVHSNRGEAYYYKHDFDHAISDFDQAIQLKPDYAVAYYDRGAAYILKGDSDRAIVDFNQAIQLKPDYAAAYCNRGTTYAFKGDHDRAITDFNQAIQLEPDFAEVYYNRGFVYTLKGNPDRAIADYSHAIRLKPDFAGAYNNRGTSYLSLD
jgi:tetratricopeptide (TPR) repeat protein